MKDVFAVAHEEKILLIESGGWEEKRNIKKNIVKKL